jgi:hypothetical protein
MTFESATDQELARVARSDASAFAELYDRYFPDVVRFCSYRARLLSTQLSGEIQEPFSGEGWEMQLIRPADLASPLANLIDSTVGDSSAVLRVDFVVSSTSSNPGNDWVILFSLVDTANSARPHTVATMNPPQDLDGD